MIGIGIVDVLSWLLVAFFLLGAVLNAFPSAGLRANYKGWGYPDWFHYVTAILELAAAALLAFGATRLPGAMLGAAVMLAAMVTVLRHREYAHALAPLVILLLTLVVAWAM